MLLINGSKIENANVKKVLVKEITDAIISVLNPKNNV